MAWPSSLSPRSIGNPDVSFLSSLQTLKELTDLLKADQHLTQEQVIDSIGWLRDENVPESDKADFLRALRQKGETSDEMMAFVDAFLDLATDPKIDPEKLNGPLLDISGTGGDQQELFNVSSTAMFILAAAGVVVVKHGNRGATTRCGSADVLEALGTNIHLLPPELLRQCVYEVGIGYIFAQDYHPAFKAIAPVRKMLAKEGIPTVFNKLGPLLNPARPHYQLAGVFSTDLLPHYGHVLQALGRKQAWVVHGTALETGGIDKVSVSGETHILKVSPDKIERETISPEMWGLTRSPLSDLRGAEREHNAEIIRKILSGTLKGPKRDFVAFNAAAGFVVVGFAKDLSEGLALANYQIDSGAAEAKLRKLEEFSKQHPPKR